MTDRPLGLPHIPPCPHAYRVVLGISVKCTCPPAMVPSERKWADEFFKAKIWTAADGTDVVKLGPHESGTATECNCDDADPQKCHGTDYDYETSKCPCACHKDEVLDHKSHAANEAADKAADTLRRGFQAPTRRFPR